MSNSSNSTASEAEVPFPNEGRLLGLDPGEKRIGVAISTYEQNIASPLETFTRHGPGPDADYFRHLVKDYMVVGLVVGLPVHMSGDEGEQARRARELGDWLSELLDLPVRYHDERFTSAMAEEHLQSVSMTSKQRKARRDKLAAMYMLQSFLEAPDRDATPGAM
ncbi:MAG: Holliday junction resolvase RuvX [Planctomycetaceae bacterium]